MLVAFLLAFVWSLMGVFHDRHKLLALVVAAISGAISAHFFGEIFT